MHWACRLDATVAVVWRTVKRQPEPGAIQATADRAGSGDALQDRSCA